MNDIKPGVIDESNWGIFAAVVLEAEAAHWQAEYEQITRKHGSSGAKQIRSAWLLGARMLERRASEYRAGEPRVTVAVDEENRHD